MAPEQAFEKWWTKQVRREVFSDKDPMVNIDEWAKAAYLAATERAAGIAERNPCENAANVLIAQKISGLEAEVERLEDINTTQRKMIEELNRKWGLLRSVLEKIILKQVSTYCPYCVRQAEIAKQALK